MAKDNGECTANDVLKTSDRVDFKATKWAIDPIQQRASASAAHYRPKWVHFKDKRCVYRVQETRAWSYYVIGSIVISIGKAAICGVYRQREEPERGVRRKTHTHASADTKPERERERMKRTFQVNSIKIKMNLM